MIILAVESSAKTASVAIMKDDMIYAEQYLSAGLTHSETLVPMMQETLAQANLSPIDIDYCAVSCGPGSFTGVRIGVCAVKGFALPLNIPCVGVSTLEAMAYNGIDHDGIICACMDARRAQVYNALFSCTCGVLTRLTEDRALSIDALLAELSTVDQPVFLVGDGAVLCYNKSDGNSNIRILSYPCCYQRGSGVAMAAQKRIADGKSVSAKELLPSYLRPSQAERERAEKLKNTK